jgi:hypothetical protein
VRHNLAQKTYDVFIYEDDRWLVDSHHTVRSVALERAEVLIADKRYEGVRVVSESQRSGSEEVLLEVMIDLGNKPIKIVAIDDAPLCETLNDFFRLEARLTAGRLLRELLDQNGQTALELAFDYGAIRQMERNDRFFSMAMSRVATVQARQSNAKPGARSDVLYAAFEKIKENARVTGEDSTRLGFLENLGLAGLIEKAPANTEGRRLFILGTLALALKKRADWSDKLAFLIELSNQASDDFLKEYIDEIAAEILDGNTAVTDFFSGFADPVSAMHDLTHLAEGRCQRQNSRTCLAQFNDLMAKRPMPATQAVLFGRVARMLGGVRPMTREGIAAEQDALRGLVRDLTHEAGVGGGAAVAGAVTERARIVFADPDDLTTEDAIGHVLALLPYRAVRLGFLLDLIGSKTGQKNEQAVLNVMARLVQQLTSMSSLVPDGMPSDQVHRVMHGLKSKLAGDALPEKWRALFSDTLDRLVARGEEPKEDAGTTMIFKMEDAAVTQKKKIERRVVETGEILFQEGETADEAYLIIDGSVQIYRNAGNQEVVLATLGRGDILGEMSLIDNQPRMASARAVGEVSLTVISRDDLASRLNRLNDSDKVLRRLMDVFVNRLRGQGRIHE